MKKFGMFVVEPEQNSVIFHLSLDDDVALCGRRVSSMICIGETDTADSIFGISTSTTTYRYCCRQCESKYHELGRMDNNSLVTTTEAARLSNVTRQAIIARINRGLYPSAKKYGRDWVLDLAEVMALIESPPKVGRTRKRTDHDRVPSLNARED